MRHATLGPLSPSLRVVGRAVSSSTIANRALPLLSLVALLFAGPTAVFAQATTSPAPAREAPRPQDIDPAVDTSRPGAADAAPARETPQPQGINPGVDTSATTPPEGATAPVSAKPAPAAEPTAPSASGAQPGGATRTTQGQGKGKAQDRIELDTTQITGNRELPKVLYIVPWKRADLGDLVGKPVNSLLDEVLAPVDRDVFKRENRYYRALMPEGPQPAGGQSATPASSAPNAPSASGTAAPGTQDER